MICFSRTYTYWDHLTLPRSSENANAILVDFEPAEYLATNQQAEGSNLIRTDAAPC